MAGATMGASTGARTVTAAGAAGATGGAGGAGAVTNAGASPRWQAVHFDDLTPRELQYIYMARQQVFVIEQACIYLDVDGADEHGWHLAAWPAGDGPVSAVPLAYARLLPPGLKYAEPSMGRVITTEAARGTGLGRELVRRALELAGERWPGQGLRISAQARLERFYAGFGFVPVGEPYLEDDIPHIEMLRAPGG